MYVSGCYLSCEVEYMIISVLTNGLKALKFEDMLDDVKEMGINGVEIAAGGFWRLLIWI